MTELIGPVMERAGEFAVIILLLAAGVDGNGDGACEREIL